MAEQDTGKPSAGDGPPLLLVVDMINGFLDPKGSLYCGDEAREIIPFVRKRIRRYREAGHPILFVADSHDPEDPEFNMWPAHCIRGTWESEVIPELQTDGVPRLEKQRYSAFYQTGLDEKLRQIRPSLVEIVGVCTNICVLYTAQDLYCRQYRTRVPRQGVASFDRDSHEFALRQIDKVLGHEVV